MGKRIMWMLALLLAIGLVAIGSVTVWVQREAPFQQDKLVTKGRGRALILYHPSRDAHFSDDVSLALARGFEEAGYRVDRWTMTAQTPRRPEDFAVMAIVSNTYFWAPDWPTQRYLARADLSGMNVIAVIGGAGNTQRAQGALARDIVRSGAKLISIRALWTSRPNQPGIRKEVNHQAAMALAHWMALDAGTKLSAALPEGWPAAMPPQVRPAAGRSKETTP